MFSRSCEYALQAILYIALHSGKEKKVGLNEIADAQNIPSHFLSKILQTLVKHKILGSSKGRSGGFYLMKASNKLKLMQVVEVIDGLSIFDRCGIGLKKCSDTTPCPIHFEYKVVKEKIRSLLTDKTVSELSQEVDNGQFLIFNK